MSQPFIRNLLGRQRKRAQATILGYAERTFYDRLSTDERAHFRHTVLAALSAYHEGCLDMIESSVSDGMMTNEIALELVAQLNERLAQAIATKAGVP